MRRVLVLREQGQAELADRLEGGELAAAVAAAREDGEAGGLSEEELRTIFTTESERVANAVVLAELLVPLLAGLVPAAVAPVPAAPAVRSPSVAAGTPPTITDLLDAMLAYERSGRTAAPAAKREP